LVGWLVGYADTQPAIQLQQERIEVVCLFLSIVAATLQALQLHQCALWNPSPKFCEGSLLPYSRFWYGDGHFLENNLWNGAGKPRIGRKGDIPGSRNLVLGGLIQTHQYQFDPPSARLWERGMPPLQPLRGRSPHHSSLFV